MSPIMPFTIIFSIFLISGSLIALSARQWIYVWLGLEINLFSFIPLITFNSERFQTERAIKYFLVQAIGRGLLLLGAAASTSLLHSVPIKITSLIIIAGLIIKLGLAPLHFWLPQVISGLRWPICIILATWQKLAPIILIIKTVIPHSFILLSLVAMIRALTGGIGGLNQTLLRPLLAYSSIGHIGWITASILISSKITLIYFSIYIIITMCLISALLLRSSSQTIINHKLAHYSPANILCVALLLLSLGGIPPLLGFLPKWLVLSALTEHTLTLLSLTLIMGSLINLFYYLNIFLNLVISKSPVSFNLFSPNKLLTILTLTGSITLPLLQPILIYAMTILHKS